MNQIRLGRLKARLSFLRPPAIFLTKRWIAFKYLLASCLRSIELIRNFLNLPSSRMYTWEEWRKVAGNRAKETPIDPEIHFEMSLPKCNQDQVHWFYHRNRSVTIQRRFVAELVNGLVWGHQGGAYFTENRDLLWDFGREHWMYFSHWAPLTKLSFPKPERIPGTVAIIANRDAYRNFSHWIIDVIPKFSLLERAGFSPEKIDTYFIGHADLPFQRETFERAGIPLEKIRMFEETSFLQADRLIVPFHSTYWNMALHTSALSDLRKLFEVEIPRQSPTRRLFISREDAKFRRLVQESRLREPLQKMGFEFVVLSGVGLADTARLFSEAKIVVGPIGSGLMNIAFSHPGGKLIEIIGPGFFNCHHWYLSKVVGFEHYYYMGKGNPVAENVWLTDSMANINIDPDDFVAFLKRALEE
ncbi:MAG: glycosyltransferase family 61 protein [Candidatus Riflebacteria bacterium]|nr:glycosyltransferase family 61 protein [Candidatus Riflebacteria bacterium]